jgi:hypothetical protein
MNQKKTARDDRRGDAYVNLKDPSDSREGDRRGGPLPSSFIHDYSVCTPRFQPAEANDASACRGCLIADSQSLAYKELVITEASGDHFTPTLSKESDVDVEAITY